MDSPEVETGRYGTDIKRRLELYMHKDRLGDDWSCASHG